MGENAISFADLQDEWVDEQDGSAWIVSKDAVQDYDLQWENDEEWDEVASEITTSGGNTLTRKCLHMWGQRLCLCQFLGWMDSHKYKCTQSVGAISAPAMPGVMGVPPKMEKKKGMAKGVDKKGKKKAASVPWIHEMTTTE